MTNLTDRRIKKTRRVAPYFTRRFLSRRKGPVNDFIAISLRSGNGEGGTLHVNFGADFQISHWNLHKKRPRRRALKSLRRLRDAISDLIDHLEAENKRLSG